MKWWRWGSEITFSLPRIMLENLNQSFEERRKKTEAGTAKPFRCFGEAAVVQWQERGLSCREVNGFILAVFFFQFLYVLFFSFLFYFFSRNAFFFASLFLCVCVWSPFTVGKIIPPSYRRCRRRWSCLWVLCLSGPDPATSALCPAPAPWCDRPHPCRTCRTPPGTLRVVNTHTNKHILYTSLPTNWASCGLFLIN